MISFIIVIILLPWLYMYTGWWIINIVRLYVVNFFGLDISISKIHAWLHRFIVRWLWTYLALENTNACIDVTAHYWKALENIFFPETIHQREKSFIPEPQDNIITKDEEIKKYVVNRRTISRTLRQATHMN